MLSIVKRVAALGCPSLPTVTSRKLLFAASEYLSDCQVPCQDDKKLDYKTDKQVRAYDLNYNSAEGLHCMRYLPWKCYPKSTSRDRGFSTERIPLQLYTCLAQS